ncbi:hypothetical protein ACIPPJ_33425 [Streptomyces sp. NPDC086091]|uniref:hypothetical protein n=1 Tax=Streptomyces sp. NPDC086091 TaxID=3365751 RepID=UPI003822EDC6
MTTSTRTTICVVCRRSYPSRAAAPFAYEREGFCSRQCYLDYRHLRSEAACETAVEETVDRDHDPVDAGRARRDMSASARLRSQSDVLPHPHPHR